MTEDALEKLERSARAQFAPGHGHWIGDDRKPAMSIAKEDMLWLLDQIRLLRDVPERLSSYSATNS